MKTYKEIDGITYTYRIALARDIDQVMEVIEDGREELKRQGNGQWQFGYPNRDNFLGRQAGILGYSIAEMKAQDYI